MVRPRRLLLLAGMAAGPLEGIRCREASSSPATPPRSPPPALGSWRLGARRWVRWGNGDCIWVGSRSKRSPHLATGSVLSVHTLEMDHAIGLPEGYRSWVAVVSQPAILGDQEAAVLHSGRVDQPVGRVAGK
jgi:hypothetical protein